MITSKVGQPLSAEVTVNTSTGETISSVKIADEPTFVALNMPYGPLARSISSRMVDRGDQNILRLTSTQPVKSSVLQLAVEIMSDKGWTAKTLTLSIPGVVAEQEQVAATGAKLAVAAMSPEIQKKVSSLEATLSLLVMRSADQDRQIAAAINRQKLEAEEAAARLDKLAADATLLWYEKLTGTEFVLLILIVGTLLSPAGVCAWLLWKRAPKMVFEGNRVRILGLGKMPIEGECSYVESRGEMVFNIVAPTEKPGLVKRLRRAAVVDSDTADAPFLEDCPPARQPVAPVRVAFSR